MKRIFSVKLNFLFIHFRSFLSPASKRCTGLIKYFKKFKLSKKIILRTLIIDFCLGMCKELIYVANSFNGEE